MGCNDILVCFALVIISLASCVKFSITVATLPPVETVDAGHWLWINLNDFVMSYVSEKVKILSVAEFMNPYLDFTLSL
jgi:selenophosphate synthetase-related protein